MQTSRSHCLGALALLALLTAAAPAFGLPPELVSYQGQLLVDGQPFTGDADFKFALLCGASSAWSNDGSSSNGSEPTAAVTLPVEAGLFSVHLGDAALGMVALEADLVDACATPQLRVWVDSGAGFEQLSDQPLASSPFALVSDVASRATAGFSVDGGNLLVRSGYSLRAANAGNSTTAYIVGEDGTVGCEILRFGDGTSMTTAPAGGADSDWIVSGNDMYAGVPGFVGVGTATPDRKLSIEGGGDITSTFTGGFLRMGNLGSFYMLVDQNELQAVSSGVGGPLSLNAEGGNVGVGTVNPASKLHVVGDARVDGTEGNGIDTRNPNATTAILRLGWQNDVARIRIGGSGVGSNGGLDIQGTSDASLLRILNNGDATISGNLTVLGSITGGGGGTAGFLAIPPSAFNEEETNQMDVHRSSVLLHGRTAGQGLTFEAPVNLPNGATITQFRVYLTDSDATRNIQTFLLRDPLGTAGTPEIIATLATTGTPGSTTLTSGALSHVVDNANNSYVVACNWTTPTTVTACAVNGMRVSYTAP